MNVLIVDDGTTLRGYDCREVLRVEEIRGAPDVPEPERFLVRLGRAGREREVRCREVMGFYSLSAREIRPLPPALRDRLDGEAGDGGTPRMPGTGGNGDAPWGVGITERGLCLLF